ncbi:MAG: 7,8-didemethyl-8-hydroxy-5-deazariboflavin synthase subunit CofH [Micrococcales bacterium]|nr:MAG: 7,8-didemethyl-8-hydroxy-5-deazariboflavin synthase subunit CofH [Micrococcales bacterium]
MLQSITAEAGLHLRARLTVHPEYVHRGEPWIDPRVAPHVAALAGPDGLARPGVIPAGLPWQEPDGGLATTGRSDLHVAVDTQGRQADRRGDFDDVYGDWDEVRADAQMSAAGDRGGSSPRRCGSTMDPAQKAALAAAEHDPACLQDEHALTLMTAEGELLDRLCALADDLRRETVGDVVSYVVNRNINFTNVCYSGCRFCAFAQRRTDADAYSLSKDEVADRAEEAWQAGATEVCLQGGIDPSLPVTAYTDIVAAIRRRLPDMHIHAFSPMEISHGAAIAGVAVAEYLVALRDAGLSSIPGTAAEILDDEVRWVLTKGKLPTAAWIEVIKTAHQVGLRSSATMMYGHVDHPRHWVAHLRLIRQIQEETGGFTEFVPLPFVHQSAPLYLAGVARPGPTMRDNRAVHAMARLMLHGVIDHVQVSWVKLGVTGSRTILNGGADDLGGTLMEETISRMAGSQHGSAKTPAEIADIATGIGRPTRQRSTLYETVTAHLTADSA